MNLQAPESVQKLQNALHAKAKGSPGFPFYALYDKVYRNDILNFAYRQARSNGGAPGVDGQDFSDIEAYGVERWLGELAQALKEKTYRAQAVRRVYIPKANGKRRSLGIPTVRDRVAQTAAVLVLTPIAEADAAMRAMMQKLKLTVNDDKTHTRRLPAERFDFPGYTFGRCYSAKTGRAYLGTRPSAKSLQKVSRTIHELTSRRWLLLDPEDRVARLNRTLSGWANYFCLGPVSRAYSALDRHAKSRLRRWLCKKHKHVGRGMTRFPDEYLYNVLGLTRLPERTRHFPWAKA